MPFKEHGVLIYLDKKLLVGFNKLMGEKELGRSFAALYCFVEGLYQHGYLSEREYKNHKKRYSVPLTKDPQQVMLEEVDEAHARKELNRMFGQVIEQWSLHTDPAWRGRWLAKAKQHGDVPNAVRLLAFVEATK